MARECCGNCKYAVDAEDGKSVRRGEDIYCTLYKKVYEYEDFCRQHEED